MTQVLDLDTLARLSLLGRGALEEIVDSYATDAPRRLGALRAAISTGDLEQICEVLHALKGASLTMGAAAVAELCAEGEKTAGNADWDAFLPELQGRVETAVEALRARVRDTPS
jgi:HPt (histidine-containing phosphotransfer) domain-containing protein